MMRGGSKMTHLEPPDDSAAAAAAAADDDDVFACNGNNDPLAPSGENDQIQFQIEEGDEAHVQDSEAETEEEENEGDDDKVPEEGERPKLDDEFYEIEAIRRKRVRKGQLQYLIKWHNWPETANTWEPLENLQSIPDVIDAFEESLRSGKHRKRKRKHAVHHTLPKKRQQRSITSYSLRQFATDVADNHHQSAPISDLNLADVPALPQTVIFADELEENGDASSLGKAEQVNENQCTNVSQKVVKRENYSDPKVTELKATTPIMATNGINETGSGHIGGQSNMDCKEPVQSGHCRGAKRRKSGSVKRFKRDSYVCEPDDTQNKIIVVQQAWTEIADFGGNYSHKTGDTKSACNIVKIIKPLSYSASVSSNIPDIIVTFMAMRSDGTEVMVDNKYLKAYNPLLLINFYEQHLRFNPTLCPSLDK